jgi:hypothetical protein
MFGQHGSGKRAGSLKFAESFHRTLSFHHSKEAANTSNWLTRPSILKSGGMSLADFPSHEKAMNCADDMIVQNQQDHRFRPTGWPR